MIEEEVDFITSYLGKELKFYRGIPEIFEKTKKIVEENSIFQEYNIKVEHYIVSTGMKNMIEGSIIKKLLRVFGAVN